MLLLWSASVHPSRANKHKINTIYSHRIEYKHFVKTEAFTIRYVGIWVRKSNSSHLKTFAMSSSLSSSSSSWSHEWAIDQNSLLWKSEHKPFSVLLFRFFIADLWLSFFFLLLHDFAEQLSFVQAFVKSVRSKSFNLQFKNWVLNLAKIAFNLEA